MTSGAFAVSTGAALAVCLTVLSAGCTSGSHEKGAPRVPSASTYVARECPADVAAALVGTVECGTLTVPENRGDGTGTVRLLVASLTPAETVAEDPIVVVGTDLATRPNYAGIGTLTQKTGRRVVFLEPRGTVHSEPSLACPQPDDPSEMITWRDRTGSPAWRRKASSLASTCFSRLESSGVDIGSYGVTEMAADVADLVTALHLAPVDLVSYGSASRIAFEVMRAHSDSLRAVVLDSPDVPGYDPRALAARGTRSALAQVLRWCDQDPDCRAEYADPTGLLRRALAAISGRPMSMAVETLGGRQRVVLDPALLVRVARQTLTDGGSAGSWGLPDALPALLAAVADRDRAQVASALSELLGAQGPLCPGYRSKCMSAHVVAEGVYNTVVCGDVAPITPSDRTARTSGRGFHEAYDRSWWWDVCDHWPVAAADQGTAGPVRADVPVLVMVGGLAAPTPEHAVRAAIAGLRNATLIRAPTGSHNVIGIGCLGQVRTVWLNDLRPVPTTPDCVDERVEW